jgi:tRNA(fMet)-specific endonuclease VapC
MSTADFDPAASKTSENHKHRHGINHLEGTIERIEIIAFDLAVARHHCSLLAHARRAGQPRGAHDLQIAATARATDRTVITTDTTAFEGLPGVNHRLLG